ncbi:MAG: fasciclin domain-containing protein [Bacteroidales bacterium]|nr:fasciclin domain-containing protein [Bacteroidales bacterium]MCF8391205.1 fasciclin domain-containing protein [Bacteroidales bacterium]
MKKPFQIFLAALFAVWILGLTGCSTNQDRYEDPPWLGGTSIETLEERGNYTIFLSLMEKANYKDPISKQLFTLFVPDDDAFNAYFQSAGITSVDDLSEDEAVQLFTLHVLRNPRSRYYLIYEYAWSELQTPKAEYASLFHRKMTPSTSTPYKEIKRYVPGEEGQEVNMYTGNKNIPLWTYEFFGDFGGAQDGSDYKFMYPGSDWEKNYTSNLKGMNWHNAMVIPNPEIPDELEVRTASGFIYFLDRVVPPMPSIEEYMIKHQDKYGLYYDILQRFATYGNPKIDEDKQILYRKSYDLIFDLAEERGPSTNTAVPPQNMWTAFLPPDDVLQKYLNETVLQYYTSIDEVPRVTLYYILQSQLSGALVVPSKLKNGYFNAFGDPTVVTEDDLVSAYMCSNGVVYESKKVLEPNVFTTVPGLLFFDKDYSTLLFVLNQANMLASLSNPDSKVTLFATTNAKLEEYGIRYNPITSLIESRGPVDGTWRIMATNELVIFAQDQIYKGELSDLNGPDKFVEMSSGNFIHYANNEIMSAENQATGNIATVQEVIVNDRNGLLVKVDNPIQSRVVMGKILYGAMADTSISKFVDLLVATKLLDTRFRDPITKEVIPNLKFLAADDYWTALIPTNEAMLKAEAEGLIPAAADSLNSFIMYHFIKGDVVFDDGMESGVFSTNRTYRDTIDFSNQYSKITVTNLPGNLSVTDLSGQQVSVEHEDANILVRKGVLHKINSVLKYYK